MKKLLYKISNLAIFKNLKVSYKIAGILVFMIIITVGVGIIGLMNMGLMNQSIYKIFNSNTTVITPMSEFLNIMHMVENITTKAAVLNDSPSRSALSGWMNQVDGEVGNFLQYIPADMSAEFKKKWESYWKTLQDVFDAVQHRDTVAAPILFLKFSQESQALYAYANTMTRQMRSQGINVFNKSQEVYKSAFTWLLWVSSIGVVIAILLGIIIAASIVYPLNNLRKAAEILAEGDLQAKAEIDSNDEVGRVGRAFNYAVVQLREMVKDASDYAQNIQFSGNELFQVTEITSATLKELNKLVESLAQGATIQTNEVSHAVDTIKEAIASTESMTKTTININDICKDASSNISKSSSVTSLMIEIMNNLVNTVNNVKFFVQELAADSHKIQEMVDVINDISEKTSLLSVNASIEASRAGVHGRGFSVVAANINELSNQAQRSVNHINKTIKEIFKKTGRLVEIVERGADEVLDGRNSLLETVTTFKEVIKSLEYISNSIANISSSAYRVGEYNSAVIVEMDKVSQISQDNTAAVQELSASFQEQYASTNIVINAAAKLQITAEKLAAASGKFKIETKDEKVKIKKDLKLKPSV